MPKKIEISHRTVIFTIAALIITGLIYYIRDILLMVLVAAILTAILNPSVNKLSKYKIPRTASILLVYVGVIAVFIITIAGLTPPLIEQTTTLVNRAPDFINGLSSGNPLIRNIVADLLNTVGQLPAQIGRPIISILSNLINVIVVLVLAFYMLSLRPGLLPAMTSFFGKSRAHEINKILLKVEHKLGGWVRGQVSLMALVALFTYIGLVVLGIPFSLSLAFWAGLMEIIPYIGPFLAAVPALVIALGISPLTFVATLALYFLIQQVENYIFVPKVMQKSAGVNPLITIIALSVGLKLAGIGGILISVPVVIIIQVIAHEYLAKN